MSTLQGKLNWLFDEYINKKLTKEEYINEIDSLASERPDEVKKEFGYRIDNRSLAEFASHMLEQMEIERDIIEHWITTFGQYFGDAKFEYSGIYDEARLICESSTTKEQMKKPDIIIDNGKIQYLEIKQCPCLHKATYKTADLKHYNSLGNVYMLTAHTKGKFSKDKVSFYTILSPDGLANVLEDGRRGILKSEKRREMGYKKAVQFDISGMKKYFEIQEI